MEETEVQGKEASPGFLHELEAEPGLELGALLPCLVLMAPQ